MLSTSRLRLWLRSASGKLSALSVVEGHKTKRALCIILAQWSMCAILFFMKAIAVFFLSVVIVLLSPLSLATHCCAFNHLPVASATPAKVDAPCHDPVSSKPCCDHHVISPHSSIEFDSLDLSAEMDCQCDQSLVYYVLPVFSAVNLYPAARSTALGTLSSAYHSRFIAVLDRPPIA